MSVFKIDNIPVSFTYIIGDTNNICDNLSHFYRAVMMPQCPSVCPSVTFRSLLGAVITLDGILRK